MYVGVDIGGTKTLVAVLDDNGVMTESNRFPTPRSYDEFLVELKNTISQFKTHEFHAGGLAMPVTVFDRDHGVGVVYSNLPWKDVPIHTDVEKIMGCPITIDNDAKLGALSEALLLKDRYHKVLYVTVSTGIGFALVSDGVIDENVGDSGGKTILVEHNGKTEAWEDFASGHAIVERYGKRAADIDDMATWQTISHDISVGLIELVAILQPDVIVIGGSVGTYFAKYGELLNKALRTYETPLMPIPPVIGAQRAEEAVVYGCYDIAKQQYGSTTATH